MDMSTAPAPSSDRLPSWLAETLDVLAARRRLVVATAIGLVLLGAIVALVLPSVLPAQPVVGAAVGIASALLATALALAMDASDLVVRGTRHVHAAGGTVDVRVGRQPDDVGPLLAAVARHASDGQVRVALSPASRSAGVPGPRAAALAEALARTGRRVLLTDLTRGGSPAAGLSDVIAGARSLAESVRFEQELYLARLAVGSDPDVAIGGFADWAEGLPSDLEVLVAALPPLADRGVLAAAGVMDLTLVLVEVDRTERVDLIASLDAVDASGLTSELVLVDPHRTVGEPGPDRPDVAGVTDGPQGADDPDDPVTADDDPDDADEPHVTAGVPDTHLESPEPPAVAPAASAADDTSADDGLFEVPDEDASASGPDVDGAPGEEGADTVATDATAEILLTHDPSPDDLSAIWDAPEESTAEAAAPDADRAVEADAQPEPAVGKDPGPRPGSAPDEPAPAAPPAPEPDPAPAPAPEPEPEPARAPEPEPEPAPAAAPAAPAARVDEGLDPAALEVARTSAALHQLAQQIWDRDED